MASVVADPGLAAALDALHASLDELVAAGVEPVDARDAAVVIAEVEAVGSRVRAVQLGVLATVGRRGLYKADGHASAKVMVRHHGDLSDVEAARRAKASRALGCLPAVAAALASGAIGACQVERIARTHANPRVRAEVEARDELFAELARDLSYRDLDAVLTDWERLVDGDGAGDRAERTHANRSASITAEPDGSCRVRAGCGGVQGAELTEVFRAYVAAEWQRDWAEARARLGDAATADDLARTDAQRRMDALHQIFLDAAAAQAATPGGSILVGNVLIDQTSFERQLRALAGDDLEPDPRADTLLHDALTHARGHDDAAPAGSAFRCATLDGHPLDPTEVTAALLVGHVRRAVIRSDGVVVDHGRKVRLFRGPSQLAAMLQRTTCYWPGCHVPVSECQIDHLDPWSAPSRGPTDQTNAGPACGRHNRHRHHGHTVVRDTTGRWHTYRPDGTEIT